MNKTLVALAGIAAVIIVAFLGYHLVSPQLNRCEAIFQQTAPTLETNFKFLETEGSVVLGSSQMQQLSDRATEIALNLKTCCVMAGDSEGSLAQFNECKATAVLYEKQVAEAADAVKDVVDASAAEKAGEQEKAAERLTAVIEAATQASQALERQVNEISKQQQNPDDQSSQSETPADPTAEPGQLRARATLTPGGEEAAACIYVYAPEQDIQGNRKQIDYNCSVNQVFTLPAGKYVISATSGNASTSVPVTVEAGKLADHVLVLNAGYYRPRAFLVAGGEEPDACFYVSEPKANLQGQNKQIDYGCSRGTVFTLPAGDYLVSAVSGNASTSTTLKIEAGQITDHSFDLNAGYLRTRAALTAGGEQISACFYVKEPKEDLDGNHRQIDYGCQDNVVFTLPAGEYMVSAVAGDASASTPLAVQAGQVTDHFFALDAGYLRAKVVTSGGEPASACVYVYHAKPDIQGNPRQINYTCSPTEIFTLPAGTYAVRAQTETASATATPEIRPGEMTEVVLTLK